ncbi:MAG TPA: MOSC domain-containing protein [Pyrinomonadaceae bacterium]|nr:MOSC domain-containing protein [Pyrinomonadaceae bacterium]
MNHAQNARATWHGRLARNHAQDARATKMTAHIFQLNVSPGGVPKTAVREADVNELGLAGDDHRFPKIHGGPERAVCLFSLERILELQSEGHPIFPGAVGENVTISGLDWTKIEPGLRLALGDEVVVELTTYTKPCNTIPAYFVDGQYQRIWQQAHPGYSRIYARVLKTGKLIVGQSVEIMNGESPSAL